MEFILERLLNKQQFLQVNDKLHEGVEIPTRNIRFSTEHWDQQANTQDHDERWKRLGGGYRKSSAFSGYHIFAPACHIEKGLKDAIFRFHKTKNDDPIMAATYLFGNIINIHPI